MEALNFDPTLTTIGGLQDPTSELDIHIQLFDRVLNHNQQHYNGIDIGRIGFIFRVAEPHLYLANSLPEVVDIVTAHPLIVDQLILDSVMYLRQRNSRNQLLVASRTTEAQDMPGNPNSKLPQGLKEILDGQESTLDLLASSFGNLRCESVTLEEEARFIAWKQRTMQIKEDA